MGVPKGRTKIPKGLGRIEGKVADVLDEVCQTCHQCWQGECRAYRLSHSDEETAHRGLDPRMMCAQSIGGKRDA